MKTKTKFYIPSPAVCDGKLRGTTDAEGHFHFLYPRCADNRLMQILDCKKGRDGPVQYAKDKRHRAKRDFKISLSLHCLRCSLDDAVEISNDGWQGGKLEPDGLIFHGTPIYPVSS